MSNATVVLDNVSKSFGHRRVLHSISITTVPGRILCLFGRNGAGKTTLLRIIAGITRTRTGSVILFDNHGPRSTYARSRIGVIGHDTMLYEDLSVADNLRFFGQLYRVKDIDARVENVLKRVDLLQVGRTPVRQLSRGMKQRLAIARAFLHEPELVLLDEPFTGLDNFMRRAFAGFLDAYREGGGSVIMTTHDLEAGWRQSDDVAVLDRGKLSYIAPRDNTPFETFADMYNDVLAQGKVQ